MKQIKEPTKKQYIVGWVETKPENLVHLEALARELLDREKVAAIKYSDYASIYFFHPSMINKELIQKLEWKVRTPEGQPPAKATLLFILYARGVFMPPIHSSVLDPEFIGTPKKEEPPKEAEELKGTMSPITSDEGVNKEYMLSLLIC